VNSPPLEPAPALTLDDGGDAIGLRVADARHAGEAFERARLVDVLLVRCDLSGCDFSESTWRRVELVDCRLSAVELPQVRFDDVRFEDCRLDDANLRMAHLHRVELATSVLQGAELIAAQLEEVTFRDCDLSAADFSGARCAQVDLRGARLDGLRGVASLGGATVGFDQLVGLAPDLARALGMTVRPDDETDD
jgi:uncharacterized protein YjbI with pentapeptide repeats